MTRDIAQVLAIWLHTVAFVIAWGYYGVLGRIVLPGLARSLELPGQAATLAAIERRALPLIIVSLVLFTLTGTYLLVSAPQYAAAACASRARSAPSRWCRCWHRRCCRRSR